MKSIKRQHPSFQAIFGKRLHNLNIQHKFHFQTSILGIYFILLSNLACSLCLQSSISCYNQIRLNLENDNNTTFKDRFIFWLLIETCCRILMKSFLIILKFCEVFSKKENLGIEKSFLYGVGVKF
jgi:hypothetical protein